MKIKTILAAALICVTASVAQARSGGWFVEIFNQNNNNCGYYNNNSNYYYQNRCNGDINTPVYQPYYNWSTTTYSGPAPCYSTRSDCIVNDYGTYHTISYRNGPY